MTDTNITILDTGFIKATNEGTQLSTGNRINSGTAFIVKAKQIIPVSKMMGQSLPELGSLTDPEFNIGSLEIGQLKINGILDMSVTEDQTTFIKLWKLSKTYGYKALYYNVIRNITDVGVNDTRERDRQLITQLADSHFDTIEPQGDIDIGSTTWTGIQFGGASKYLTDVYHIHCLFQTFTPNQIGNSKFINWELSGVMIPKGP